MEKYIKSCAAYLEKNTIYLFTEKGVNVSNIKVETIPCYKMAIDSGSELLGENIIGCLQASCILQVEKHHSYVTQLSKLALTELKLSSSRLDKNWVKRCQINLYNDKVEFIPNKNRLFNNGYVAQLDAKVIVDYPSEKSLLAITLIQVFEKCINFEDSP